MVPPVSFSTSTASGLHAVDIILVKHLRNRTRYTLPANFGSAPPITTVAFTTPLIITLLPSGGLTRHPAGRLPWPFSNLASSLGSKRLIIHYQRDRHCGQAIKRELRIGVFDSIGEAQVHRNE